MALAQYMRSVYKRLEGSWPSTGNLCPTDCVALVQEIFVQEICVAKYRRSLFLRSGCPGPVYKIYVQELCMGPE